MLTLKWEQDEATRYWADRCPLPIRHASPVPQADGFKMWESTWLKRLLAPSFPDFLKSGTVGHFRSTPANILQCFGEGFSLEGLALTVSWGTMSRTSRRIYGVSDRARLVQIEQTLSELQMLVRDQASIREAWSRLTVDLGWSAVMSSKCLHFVLRSMGCESNPPVPIDNKVIRNEVWPEFSRLIRGRRGAADQPHPLCWQGDDWPGYNRYVTAVSVWAQRRGWTTSEMETTIFDEYR